MDNAEIQARKNKRLEHLIFLPVLGAVLAIWAVVIAFTVLERASTLDNATTQLGITASSLADFNELAERVAPGDETTTSRTAAIWRALLQYPTANIWVEKAGAVTVGEPPIQDRGPFIFVAETRGDSTVHVALPEADVLAVWRSAVWWRCAELALAAIVLLALTYQLARALRQRGAAEQKMLIAQERTAQLALYRAQLEATVTLRTHELSEANGHLQRELVERTAAENALREIE